MSTATATTTKKRDIYSMFYTHKRTKEILEGKGIKVKKVEKVSIHKPSGEYYCCVNVVYVVANGSRCSTFISCKEYLANAIAARKERAREYKAIQDTEHGNNWIVISKVVQMPLHGDMARSSKEGKARHVTTDQQAVVCDCEDYINQGHYLQEHPYLWWELMKQRRVCKHIFAALDMLGYGSLRDYLKAWLPNGRLTKLHTVLNRQTNTRFSRTLNKRVV